MKNVIEAAHRLACAVVDSSSLYEDLISVFHDTETYKKMTKEEIKSACQDLQKVLSET